MNISSNAPIQRGPSSSPRGPLSANDKASANAKELGATSQSRIDRFAQNAQDVGQIKEQVSARAGNPNQALTGSAQIKSLQAGIVGQNGVLSKSIQGLPQPQNLPSTVTILKERQNIQKPTPPSAYTVSKTYSEKASSQNTSMLLGASGSTRKEPPVPNPALSAPPPRGAQLQLYAPNLKAGNKTLDIQDHGINAF